MGIKLLLAQAEDASPAFRAFTALLSNQLFCKSKFLLTAKLPARTFLEIDNFAALEACLTVESTVPLNEVMKTMLETYDASGKDHRVILKPAAPIEGLTAFQIQSRDVKSILLYLVLSADGRFAMLAPLPVLKRQLTQKSPTALSAELAKLRQDFAGKWQVYAASTPERELVDYLTADKFIPDSVDVKYFASLKNIILGVNSTSAGMTLGLRAVNSTPALAQNYFTGSLTPSVELIKAMTAFLPEARGMQINSGCKGNVITIALKVTPQNLSLLNKLQLLDL
jgi:hypothetical protein